MRLVAVVAALALGCALTAGGARARPGPIGHPPTELQRLVWAGAPVYCGSRRKRVFALTFDDGPSPWSESLLTVLRRRHAPATFFLVGSRIAVFGSAARAEAAYGAIGNHTWSHPQLQRLPAARIERELRWTQQALRTRLHVQAQLFRPPYERSSRKVARIVRRLGLLDVRWNVDSGDSRRGARPDAVVREVVTHLKPGAIVLLHDMHPWTANVVKRVLAAAREKHLWPVTVPRLLAVDPPGAHPRCYA